MRVVRAVLGLFPRTEIVREMGLVCDWYGLPLYLKLKVRARKEEAGVGEVSCWAWRNEKPLWNLPNRQLRRLRANGYGEQTDTAEHKPGEKRREVSDTTQSIRLSIRGPRSVPITYLEIQAPQNASACAL